MITEEKREGSERAQQEPSLQEWAWDTLTSMRFVISLLLVLAAACLAGTMGMNIYPTYWFKGLIGVLAASLGACSIRRAQLLYRRAVRPQLGTTPAQVKAMRYRAAWNAAAPLEQVETEVTGALRRAHYRVLQAESNPGGISLFAQRGQLGNWGSFLSHLAMLVIFIGAVYGGLQVFESSPELMVGESYTVPGAGFQVKVLDTWVELTKSGQPSQWRTKLLVTDHGRVVGRPTLWVNNPYSYRGYNFFQSNFGQGGFVLSVDDSKQRQEITISTQDIHSRPIKLGTTGWDVVVMSFSQVGTYPGGRPIYGALMFADPSGQRGKWDPLGMVREDRDAEYRGAKLRLTRVLNLTGLMVRRDPGVPVVWAGFALLMGGMMLAFYLPHRMIRVHLAPKRDLVEVLVGAAGQSPSGFEREFDLLKQALPGARAGGPAPKRKA